MTNDLLQLEKYLCEKSNMGVVERFGIYRAAGSPVTHNMGDVVLGGVSKEMWDKVLRPEFDRHVDIEEVQHSEDLVYGKAKIVVWFKDEEEEPWCHHRTGQPPQILPYSCTTTDGAATRMNR